LSVYYPKAVLNSFFGKLGDPYSSFYDPAAFMAVTLSGELMLIDLVERLSASDCAEVISVNTDGLYIRIKAGSGAWKEVLDRWQADTGMTLEVEDLRRLAILATNQYCSLDAMMQV
jgi:DNA polymerase elongation subunit (family B)